MHKRAYDRTASIVTVFAAQARRRGGACAAMQEGRRLSYAELDAHSDAMAARLVALGVRPGDIVALRAERALETLAAMLAILKAGAAYAPIDLDYPAATQAAMLADVAPRLVLAAEGAQASSVHASSAQASPVPALEALYRDAVAAPAPAPQIARDALSPAYVMFTSGSTGRPKGVVVPDRAVCRLTQGQTYAPIDDDDVVLHASPIAFDASTFEVWGALLNGAAVALLPAARPTVEEIVETTRRHGVTVAWFTAGLFHLLAESGVERMAGLRRLLAGGDVLSAPHVERARAACPALTLVNGYGPTENTTFSCCHALAPGDPPPRGDVPIGRALAYSTAHVLDVGLTPVATGETGELCVGGDGLALGYLNAPGMTAERFVTAPWGERLYRTGDLVTRDDDGVLHFRGRVDRQTKINGKRVELGALENALRRRDGVEDAAMLVDARGETKRLVGVIKARAGADEARVAAAALEALRAAFPASILPASLRVVAQFPLTANGKLDRVALLAAAEAPRGEAAASVAAPADAMERAVLAIWETLLQRAPLAVDVNFFDLGATSLQMIAAQEAIRRRLGLVVPVTLLFERSDIRSLARALDARARPQAQGADGAPREASASAALRARQRAVALKELAARRGVGSNHGGQAR